MKIQKVKKENLDNLSVGDIIIVDIRDREGRMTIFCGSSSLYLINLDKNYVIEEFYSLEEIIEHLKNKCRVIKIIKENNAILTLKEE